MSKRRPAASAPPPAESPAKSLIVEHIAEQLRPLAVPLDQVALDPNNARTHDAANLAAIAASLRQFGQVKPIVVNRANRQIEAGNGTYLAAQSLGWPTIAVVWVDHDPRQQRGFALADNRTAELAAWDQAVLDDLLAAMRDENDTLYIDLQLAAIENAEELVEKTKKTKKAPIPDTWAVVVSCADEADQKMFLRRMKAEKRKCRLLVL